MNKSTASFSKKTIRDVDVHGKTILLRADFNVPIDESGKITSDYRIAQTVPTIEYLLARNCKVVIISHLGRPGGEPDASCSLSVAAQRLHELLPKVNIAFAKDCINDSAQLTVKKAKNGEVVILENLRFHTEEEANDPDFAVRLKQASGADYFVQDGFGVVHRPHASTEAITHVLPSVAGLLLEKEVTVLGKAMKQPQHPVVAVVGGAKISDKIGFIERLLDIADTILIGGAMANTFFKHEDKEIGRSLYEDDQDRQIATILQKAKPNQLILPTDVGVATEIAKSSQRRDCTFTDITPDDYILDIGFETMREFSKHIKRASTVIWNGTLGYAELSQFAQGSSVMAEAISQEHGAVSIVGGGDTADFVLSWLYEHKSSQFTHISTGGGASLELMSGLKLPGVEALLNS